MQNEMQRWGFALVGQLQGDGWRVGASSALTCPLLPAIDGPKHSRSSLGRRILGRKSAPPPPGCRTPTVREEVK